MINITPRIKNLLPVVMFPLLLAACAIRIIAPYDDVTDSKITDLNEKIVLQLNRWERIAKTDAHSEKLLYSNNVDFYDEVNTVLDILITRNNAIDQNKIITQQLMNAKSIVADMQQLHQTNNGMGMSQDTMQLVKSSVQLAFGAIQKLQMELKKAEEK
jgi:hypothetical protein